MIFSLNRLRQAGYLVQVTDEHLVIQPIDPDVSLFHQQVATAQDQGLSMRDAEAWAEESVSKLQGRVIFSLAD